MSLASALVLGRRAKAGRMTGTCTVSRPGAETTDPVTGVVTPSTTAVYTGPCYLPKTSLQAGNVDITDAAALTAATITVEIAWDTTGVRKDDVVTVTASTTPANVGRRLRVLSVPIDDDATALRLSCEELT